MVILCQINGPSGIKAKEVFFCSSHHAGALLCAGIVNKTRDAFERFSSGFSGKAPALREDVYRNRCSPQRIRFTEK